MPLNKEVIINSAFQQFNSIGNNSVPRSFIVGYKVDTIFEMNVMISKKRIFSFRKGTCRYLIEIYFLLYYPKSTKCPMIS